MKLFEFVLQLSLLAPFVLSYVCACLYVFECLYVCEWSVSWADISRLKVLPSRCKNNLVPIHVCVCMRLCLSVCVCMSVCVCVVVATAIPSRPRCRRPSRRAAEPRPKSGSIKWAHTHHPKKPWINGMIKMQTKLRFNNMSIRLVVCAQYTFIHTYSRLASQRLLQFFQREGRRFPLRAEGRNPNVEGTSRTALRKN